MQLGLIKQRPETCFILKRSCDVDNLMEVLRIQICPDPTISYNRKFESKNKRVIKIILIYRDYEKRIK